jgi:hypothetical protein
VGCRAMPCRPVLCETHNFMIVEVCVSHMGSTNQTHDVLPEPFPETPAGIEAADWGDRTATVEQVFDDGGFVVSFDYAGGKYGPLSGAWYYVPPGAGEGPDADTWQDWWEIDSYGGRRGHKKRKAILLGRLSENTGFWWDPQGPGNCIPIDVATDGQKAIAAYLFAWSNYSPEGIAEKMDKSTQTVRQYLSDYKAGRTG